MNETQLYSRKGFNVKTLLAIRSPAGVLVASARISTSGRWGIPGNEKTLLGERTQKGFLTPSMELRRHAPIVSANDKTEIDGTGVSRKTRPFFAPALKGSVHSRFAVGTCRRPSTLGSHSRPRRIDGLHHPVPGQCALQFPPPTPSVTRCPSTTLWSFSRRKAGKKPTQRAGGYSNPKIGSCSIRLLLPACGAGCSFSAFSERFQGPDAEVRA